MNGKLVSMPKLVRQDVKDAGTLYRMQIQPLFIKWHSLWCEKVIKSGNNHMADPTPKFVQGSMGKI